ncbi:hypothetical protein A2U01_0099364, partial [Trifolium medium]|nr:hypothetical protein [Trifolium medium]
TVIEKDMKQEVVFNLLATPIGWETDQKLKGNMVDEASQYNDQELDEEEEELYVQMLFTQEEQVQKLQFHKEMVQAW